MLTRALAMTKRDVVEPVRQESFCLDFPACRRAGIAMAGRFCYFS